MSIISTNLKSLFEKKTSDLNIYNWYYAWLHLYSSSLAKNKQVTYDFIDDNLCIFCKVGKNQYMLYPPLGDCDDDILKRCFNQVNEIKYVYDGFKTDKYKMVMAHSDYIYDLDKLSELKGHGYATVRRYIRKFEKYNYVWRKAKKEDKIDIVKLIDKWKKTQGKKYFRLFHIGYATAGVKYLLDDSFSYVVIIDNQIKGFVMGDKLNKNYCFTMTRICDNNYDGLSQFLFWKFHCEMKEKGFRYANDGSDIGVKGLKYFKEKFQPIKMLPNYKIIVEKQTADIKKWV